MPKVVVRRYPSRRPTKLIEDLVQIIVEMGRPWSVGDLLNLMLVSPAWLYPVRRLLYSSVTLFIRSQWQLLHRTLADSRELASMVSEVTFIDIMDAPLSTSSYETAFQDMNRLFSRLPGLVTLRVSGPGPYARSCLLQAMESLPSPHRLTELEVAAPLVSSGFIPRMSDRNLTWTERTPSVGLRSLSLTNVFLSFRMPLNTRGFPPNLSHLSLDNAVITNVNTLQRHPPLKSLTLITPMRPYAGDYFWQIAPIVQNASQTLEYLSHTAIHEEERNNLVHVFWEIPVCPNVKTLETDSLMYREDIFPDEEIYQRFPALEEWIKWEIPVEDE